MSVRLVAVEREVWSGQATYVFARTKVGEIGVLAHHVPLLAELVQGEMVRIDSTTGEEIFAAVDGGFLSVSEDGVSILAESAELRDEIDVEQARVDITSDDEATRLRGRARLRAAGHEA
ncbi:F0F1 ATP synthase subunit epsilon [Amycolatopsis alkalitolerans]|uniref:ATP synthase epsilon chain n=1 Tax=Amycolatopsis alkalitolerans TaxID=2547244 RepID=A0A5C4LU05_9PSEU|nr:F0F1 ATP synthase subunit epsilon [Amycolatopsis alkalitolerans]TNC22132.1 F0F1 ATP synthase subunit epsilon [Amycolatopsis alkalitolerans]